MKLINTDGLALIGPGSEWFWTALSGVALVITFIAIYRQLRLQRDAAALEQVDALAREWLSEAMARNRLAILLAMRDGADPLKLPPWAVRYVGNFWDRIGYLVRAHHMDARVVYETFADVAAWWHWLAPVTEALRGEAQDNELGQHFEWLAGQLEAMGIKRGVMPPDETSLAQLLPRTVEANLEAIRTAEDLRAVLVRPMSPTVLAPEPALSRRARATAR